MSFVFSVLSFSLEKSWTSLVRHILGYLWLFEAIVNVIDFVISLSACLLLAYRKAEFVFYFAESVVIRIFW